MEEACCAEDIKILAGNFRSVIVGNTTNPQQTKDCFGIIENERILAYIECKPGFIGIFSKKKEIMVFTERAMYSINHSVKSSRPMRIPFEELNDYVLNKTESSGELTLKSSEKELLLYTFSLSNIFGSLYADIRGMIRSIQDYLCRNDERLKSRRDVLFASVKTQFEDFSSRNPQESDQEIIDVLKSFSFEPMYAVPAVKMLYKTGIHLVDRELFAEAAIKGNALNDRSIITVVSEAITEESKQKVEQIINEPGIFCQAYKARLKRSCEEQKKHPSDCEALYLFDKYLLSLQTIVGTDDGNVTLFELSAALDELKVNRDEKKELLCSYIVKKNQKMLEILYEIRNGEFKIENIGYTDVFSLNPLHYSLIEKEANIARKILSNKRKLKQTEYDSEDIDAVLDYGVMASICKLSDIENDIMYADDYIIELNAEVKSAKRAESAKRFMSNLSNTLVSNAQKGYIQMEQSGRLTTQDLSQKRKTLENAENKRLMLEDSVQEATEAVSFAEDDLQMGIDEYWIQISHKEKIVEGSNNEIVKLIRGFCMNPGLLEEYLKFTLTMSEKEKDRQIKLICGVTGEN